MKVKINPPASSQNYHRIPEFLLYDLTYGSKRILFHIGFRNNTLTYWSEKQQPIIYHPLVLARFLHFKANYNNKGIVNQLNSFVRMIEDKGYIKEINFETMKTLRLYSIPNKEENKLYNPKSKYGIIYNFEFEHLLNLHKNKQMPNNVEVWNVLLVLAYLREHIVFRPSQDYNSKKNRKKRPETYVTAEYIIAEELGLHRTTVSKCVEALDEIGIIHHENLVRVIPDTGAILNGRTLFANKYKYDGFQGYRLDSNYDYKKEVEEIKRQLKPYGEYGRTTSSDLENLD